MKKIWPSSFLGEPRKDAKPIGVIANIFIYST